MDDTNSLKERIENTVIRKTFNISGMPEAIWKDIDEFCKTFYADSRWTMLSDLVRIQKTDFKYALLFDEILVLKEKIAYLEQRIETKEVNPKEIKTLGGGTE